MSSKVRNLIEKKLKTRGEVKASDIVGATNLSRTYVNRIFQEMQKEGKLVLMGKANRARYIPATVQAIRRAKAAELVFRKILQNKGLSEDSVLDRIKAETAILSGLRHNVSRIIEYAFTEMLNNAIEHSRSETVAVEVKRDHEGISFSVVDRGVGIFKNIMQSRGLGSELEAIQDLLKGKQTTMPHRHSGEGIFFTSKAADVLIIKGSNKKLIFDSRIADVFIRDVKPLKGTHVDFRIAVNARTELMAVFGDYSGQAYQFDKTHVAVQLFKIDSGYVSRSQARRILVGLEKFARIVLDFKNVQHVGQAFADEVFRVWLSHHPDAKIEVRNANENVRSMIQHAAGPRGPSSIS